MTVLGEHASEEFQRLVTRRILEEAKLDPEGEDTEYAQEHRAAAGELADHVLSLPASDPRFWALSRLQVDDRGNPTPDSFEPGRRARDFLGGLGRIGAAPEPDAGLNELVAASADDHVTKVDEVTEDIAHEIEGRTARVG